MSVPKMALVSVVSVLFTIIIFPKGTISWTSPIAIGKIPTTKCWSFGSDPYRHQKRSFRLHSTEESLGSVGATFSPPSLSSSPATQSLLSSSTTQSICDVAIVLNTNAKGVTEDLIEAARDVVEQWNIAQQRENATGDNPKVRLLVTSTYDEARSASRKIMASANAVGSTTLVVPVGGDGTLTAMINLLWEEYRSLSIGQQMEDFTTLNGNVNDKNNESSSNERQQGSKFPIVFGYVAMGTGNALGSVVGCLPVNPNQRNRRRKRRAMFRLLRKCIRPQMTKREDFRLVLSQLIESVTQTKTTAMRKHCVPEELLALQSNKIEVDVLDLPLIRVRTSRGGVAAQITSGHPSPNENDDGTKDDRYAFFAGLGYDSLLLQDYKDLQDWTGSKAKSSHRGIWHAATTGVVGYTVAMFTRSLPKLLKLEDASRLLRDVKITTNNPESTYWIDHRRGDTMRPVTAITQTVGEAMDGPTRKRQEEDTLLYRGSAGIVATGTVPYYGGGLRLFPFARMTPRGMHLRISREIHPLEGISRIPSIFEGSFRDKSTDTFRCLDFVGHQFSVEIYESYKYDDEASTTRHQTEEGFPVQHSGESIGRCTRVELTVSSSEVPAENQYPDKPLADTGGERGHDDPMPPPIRFVTLMPPRIINEHNVMNLHP